MKFLCISAATEESPPPDTNDSKLRVWYNSIRRGLKRRNKEPRVTISEPIPIETLTQSDLLQINGVIKVKPDADEDEQSISVGDVINNEVKDEMVGQVEQIPTEAATTHPNHSVEGSNDSSSNTSVPNHIYHNHHITSNRSKESSTAQVSKIPPTVTIATTSPSPQSETVEQIVGYVWYWGNISRKESEALLRGKKDGSFLVRASSDKRFLYSLSFRSNGKTMHTRIEHRHGLFFFYSNESNADRGNAPSANDGSATLGGLIAVAMNQNNADSIFFYSRGLRAESSLHTVSLNQPLSRFQYLVDFHYESNEPKCLQYLCKFVVHHSATGRCKLDHQLHSLPVEMRSFAENSAYFPRRA